MKYEKPITKKSIPFLHYVKDGECLSNEVMEFIKADFDGYLSASHVLRNPLIHTTEDKKACLLALVDFVLKLDHEKEEIQQGDLLEYIA